ncbi:MAG: hypothetical protein BWY83_03275 [bacterium ADurb.Bin478]|nr:MAG: hypothetical protein BWY83_03275 [bacterium ADurb.Bin478]
MDRIDIRINDDLHEAVVFAERFQRQYMLFAGVQIGLKLGQFNRRAAFLRSDKQFHFSQRGSGRRFAEQHRKGNGDDQSGEDRTHPPEKSRVDPPGKHSPQESGRGVPAVRFDGFAPLNAVVAAAPLRAPADFLPRHNAEYEPRVKQHENRCDQHRKQVFHQNTDGGAQPSSERTGLLTAAQNQKQAQQFREEKKENGGGKQDNGQLIAADVKKRGESDIIVERAHSQSRSDSELKCSEHHEEQPERRGEIAHNTEQKVQAVDRTDMRRQHQPAVLKVAPAPAAVAFGHIGQSRRTAFVTAAEAVGQPDLIAGAAHQRGLDIVVAHEP